MKIETRNDVECKSFIKSFILPLNTQSYCNHDNKIAVCYDNLFETEKANIERECGKTYVQGQVY